MQARRILPLAWMRANTRALGIAGEGWGRAVRRAPGPGRSSNGLPAADRRVRMMRQAARLQDAGAAHDVDMAAVGIGDRGRRRGGAATCGARYAPRGPGWPRSPRKSQTRIVGHEAPRRRPSSPAGIAHVSEGGRRSRPGSWARTATGRPASMTPRRAKSGTSTATSSAQPGYQPLVPGLDAQPIVQPEHRVAPGEH